VLDHHPGDAYGAESRYLPDIGPPKSDSDAQLHGLQARGNAIGDDGCNLIFVLQAVEDTGRNQA
jgi:hypothetical protein